MRLTLALLAAAVAVEASPPMWFKRQAVTAVIAPSASAPSGCKPDYTSTFGIAVMNMTEAGSVAVKTISDGQAQASSGAVVSTISDGQAQAPTSAAVVSQISDGQVQAGTSTAAAVSQISDGQVQAPTKTMMAVSQISDGQIQAPTKTMMAVSQISDGQVQAPTKTAAPVTQISDGQIQATKSSAAAVSQISDGQVQATKATAVSQISDGQVQAPTKTISAASQMTDGQVNAPTKSAEAGSGSGMVGCKSDSTLQMTLNKGVLTDNFGRIGYIAANYQFQFDGPPQAGAIYTSGFSVCGNGSLALGGSEIFYQCLSGDFYNLYDRNWGTNCNPITISVLELVAC